MDDGIDDFFEALLSLVDEVERRTTKNIAVLTLVQSLIEKEKHTIIAHRLLPEIRYK